MAVAVTNFPEPVGRVLRFSSRCFALESELLLNRAEALYSLIQGHWRLLDELNRELEETVYNYGKCS
jgi:hypothetical protein